MRPFHFLPLSDSLAARIRTTRADSFGNAGLQPRSADDKPGFPCRVCLRDAELGETLLLFSFAPSDKPGPYRAVGPIFIHEHECRPFVDNGEVPEVLRERVTSLRGYDENDQLIRADLAENGLHLLERATVMFGHRRVDHIDVHLAKPGCFACRLERA